MDRNLKQNEAQSARAESTHKGVNRRSSEIQGTALGKCLRAEQTCFCWGYSEHVRKMTDTRKQKAEKVSERPIKHSLLVGNVQIG